MSHLRFKLNVQSSIVSFLIRGCLFAIIFALSITLSGASVPAVYAQLDEEDHLYPLIEEFDSAEDFIQTGDNVRIENGEVIWDLNDGGDQFIARSIPAFNGDFKLTVRGQIDNADGGNCSVWAGIGDSVGTGVSTSFGFFGAGCPIAGPFISGLGVQWDRDIVQGCQYIGNWHWVDAGRPYTAEITISTGAANLSVPDSGVDDLAGVPVDDGLVNTLWVGARRDVGTPDCSGTIESMTIIPLSAFIAPSDLTAKATYPTEVELQWSDNTQDESGFQIERSVDGIQWTKIASIGEDQIEYNDNTVTCGEAYHYRVSAYRDNDGMFSGYSNIGIATTDACVLVLHEDWEHGMRSSVWRQYGSPLPRLFENDGLDGSRAVDPNGDGNYDSGLMTRTPYNITSGIKVNYWLRGVGEIGNPYAGAWGGFTQCSPDNNLEFCDGNPIAILTSAESDRVRYGAWFEQFQEPWAPLTNDWHEYEFRIKPDGLVDFHRDGELKFASSVPLDFQSLNLLWFWIHGRSVNSDWFFDDIEIWVPQTPEWFIKVADGEANPINNANVLLNGTLLGTTNQAGMINSQPLDIGTPLVAVAEVEEMPTTRAAHDGWAYRTYLTSLDWEGDEPQPYLVQGPGEQRLVLNADHPLVLFNLVVSIEWNATDEYLDEIERAMQRASDYLLDVTDGQMALGHVSIYENAEHWTDADIQISTKNIVRPHAYIGGITDHDTSHTIRLGRAWDGKSGAEGPWDAPDGYRTIVHEFGHYALQLYDEYFGYTYAGNELSGAAPAYCTGPEIRSGDDAAYASIMYYQYNASELSDRFLPALWSPLCAQTAQWQIQRESAWQTLAKVFADEEDPPRWEITTPGDRGAVMAGPSALPSALPTWPEVEVHAAASDAQPRQLLVLAPGDQPYQGAIVALYKLDDRVIGQGFSGEDGWIEVFGAEEGDKLRASSIDGGFAGYAIVGQPDEPITMILSPVGALAAQSVAGRPHMQIIAEPGPDPENIDLLVFLHDYSPLEEPIAVLTPPREQGGRLLTLRYSPETSTYEGRTEMMASALGTGSIRALGYVQGHVQDDTVRQQSTFRLQRSRNDERIDIYSDDGNLDLHLDAGSLPGGETYLVVMPPGALPSPAPRGYTVVGDAYSITASGAVVALEKSGVLKLHYDDATLKPGIEVERLEIRRWDPVDSAWEFVSATLDAEQKTLSAPVRALGTYALMMQEHAQVYLPTIVR